MLVYQRVPQKIPQALLGYSQFGQDVLDVLEMTFLVVFCGEMAVLLMALGAPSGSQPIHCRKRGSDWF